MGGAALALLLIHGCGPSGRPGGLSADDERQLNEAATMLDANAVDANRIEGRQTVGKENTPQ